MYIKWGEDLTQKQIDDISPLTKACDALNFTVTIDF